MDIDQPEGFLGRVGGKARRAAGQAQQVCGKVPDEVEHLACDRAVPALLAGVSVGFPLARR